MFRVIVVCSETNIWRIYAIFSSVLPSAIRAGNSVVECRIAAFRSRLSRSHRFDSGSALILDMVSFFLQLVFTETSICNILTVGHRGLRSAAYKASIGNLTHDYV
jgi:hypothetical protein